MIRLRNGITFKLFALTSLFFVLFYSLITIGQLLFFEDFYQHQKSSSVKQSLLAFTKRYEEEQWDEHRTSRETAQFIMENNAQIAFLQPDGEPIYESPFRMELSTVDGGMVNVALYFFEDLEGLHAAGLKPGDTVTVEGYYDYELGRGLFYPVTITKQANSIRGMTVGEDESLTRYTGVISRLQLPESPRYGMAIGLLATALYDSFPLTETELAELQKGNMLEVNWTEAWTGVRNVIFIQPIFHQGELTQLVFAISSLHEVGESFQLMQEYFFYFGVGGIVLIILLSLLFSRIVTQPIIELNDAAARMAKLDFGVVSMSKRKDEIGSLSGSLNSLSHNLQQTIHDLQVANEQLIRDMEQKQKLEQMQKEFIANASHELQTPLSIVKGFAEGLQDDIAAHKRARYIEVILDETIRMGSLVADMLELAKLESHSSRLKKVAFSLEDLVGGVIDKLSHHFREKQLAVVVGSLFGKHAYADPKRMEQVFFNIIVNAIRHADPGSTILIHFKDEDRHICTTIENMGEHIPEDQLDFIWNRFYRGEQSRNRKKGGTGLGLAITKHILELHGSSYGVRNTEHGVAFTFTLESSVTGEHSQLLQQYQSI